jgi:hypothetical protein
MRNQVHRLSFGPLATLGHLMSLGLRLSKRVSSLLLTDTRRHFWGISSCWGGEVD